MNFSEKLKQCRSHLQLSQEDLAQMLNVTRQAITKWESGQGMPDIENIKAISKVFDVSIDTLLDDSQELTQSQNQKYHNFILIGGALGFVLSIPFGHLPEFLLVGGILGYILEILTRK